jgi:uncharacterized membrane protein YpjA
VNKQLIGRNILLGFLSWLIPFAVSFLLVKPGGEYVVPYATFKCIITVVGTLTGCYLFFRYFKTIEGDYLRNGIIVGLSWFIINVVLDTIVLIPMMKTTFENYFTTIGLGYIAIPVISITIGLLLEKKVKKL